ARQRDPQRRPHIRDTSGGPREVRGNRGAQLSHVAAPVGSVTAQRRCATTRLDGAVEVTELYRRESARLLVFFTRRTYDAQLAVDLVAETFARAYESRARVRGEQPAAWLWGIARNVLRDAPRRGSAERRALRRPAGS